MIYQKKANGILVHLSFLLVLTGSAFSHEMPIVAPETVGLSTERLSRIDNVMEKHIAQQKIAGGVILLARHGKIAHLGTYGMMDVEAGQPMTPTTLFRIASMTKQITSVAAMMLYPLPYCIDDEADYECRGDDALRRGTFSVERTGIQVHSRFQRDACAAAGIC